MKKRLRQRSQNGADFGTRFKCAGVRLWDGLAECNASGGDYRGGAGSWLEYKVLSVEGYRKDSRITDFDVR